MSCVRAQPRSKSGALNWLAENAPVDVDDDPRSVHGRRPYGQSWYERNGKVAALVDWELAHLGNPRGDIGFHLYLDSLFAVFAGQRLTGLADRRSHLGTMGAPYRSRGIRSSLLEDLRSVRHGDHSDARHAASTLGFDESPRLSSTTRWPIGSSTGSWREADT